MSDTMDRARLEQIEAAASKLAPAGDDAPGTWRLFSKLGPWQPGVYIQLPQAGTLSVSYEYQGGPEKQVGILRREAGVFVPIEPGENNIAVEVGDLLFYVLSDCAKDSIWLTYRLT